MFYIYNYIKQCGAGECHFVPVDFFYTSWCPINCVTVELMYQFSSVVGRQVRVSVGFANKHKSLKKLVNVKTVKS